MIRRVTIAILAIFTCSTTYAQDSLHKMLAIVKGDIANFTVDNLDNVYILTSTDQLKKYNSKGDSVAVFNNVKKYGKVYLIDASNPLKVLLYYKDFSTIVVLDRLLSIRNTIDLRKLNIFPVNAVAQSYDNNIWLFDEGDSKLKKIDDEGKVLIETADFRLLFGNAPSVKNIYDQDGFVYLYDPATSVYVFDYYGAMRNKLLITGWQDFKVVGKFVIGINSDTLHKYNTNNIIVYDEKLPALFKNAIKVNFTSSRLYILKPEGLEIFDLH